MKEDIEKIIVDDNKKMFINAGRPDLRIIKYSDLNNNSLYFLVYDELKSTQVIYSEDDKPNLDFMICLFESDAYEVLKSVILDYLDKHNLEQFDLAYILKEKKSRKFIKEINQKFIKEGRPELRIIKYETLYKDDLYKYVLVYDKSAYSKINYYDFDKNEISKFKIILTCSTLEELLKKVNKVDYTYSLEEIEKSI